MKTGKKVFVGLSGGVDSSVAAARLLEQGYDVTGVFIKVWHPDWLVCNWERERLDAMRVAAHLDIPFLTCDAEAAYRDDVANYFIEEYKAGRTPNPDVMCNQQVKFGRFLEFAKKQGADFIATGHYVQRHDSDNGTELHRGVDTGKDQSYFLWSLDPEQLSRALFPVGDTSKAEIRVEAEKRGLPVATKKDSQGICFLGHVDIHDFLSHYITLEPGNVLDTSGAIVGTHHGAFVYTVGQRHGFTLTTQDDDREPHFVVAKDVDTNTLTVSTAAPVYEREDTVELLSVVLREPVSVGDQLEAQFRYRQTPFSVTVTEVGDTLVKLKVDEAQERAASGQSCVLYRDSLSLGGGIIQ